MTKPRTIKFWIILVIVLILSVILFIPVFERDSEELLQQGHTNEVDGASLWSDQQTRSVRRTIKGKLLFFIPVTFNVQFTANTTSGEIKEVRRPWWAFLVR